MIVGWKSIHKLTDGGGSGVAWYIAAKRFALQRFYFLSFFLLLSC